MWTASSYRSAALLLTLLVTTCGQNPAEKAGAKTHAELSGCQAAVAHVDYGTALPIPDDVKAEIESYRTDWKAFCTDATPGKPSMADLVVKAKALEERFDKIVEAYNASLKTVDRYAKADAVSDLMVKQLPTFVPGFEGSYYEQEYFRPSTVEFKKHVRLGTDEDKRFFDAGVTLNTEFPAWMDRTWDYGGCWRFGEFGWMEELDKVLKLEKDLQTDVYKKLIAEYQQALVEPITADDASICTCKRKEAVADDLQRAIAYFEKDPSLSEYLKLTRAKLNRIEEKKTAVNSEAEKHCSGG